MKISRREIKNLIKESFSRNIGITKEERLMFNINENENKWKVQGCRFNIEDKSAKGSALTGKIWKLNSKTGFKSLDRISSTNPIVSQALPKPASGADKIIKMQEYCILQLIEKITKYINTEDHELYMFKGSFYLIDRSGLPPI